MTVGNYLYRLRCGDRAVDLMAGSTGTGWQLAGGLGGLQSGALSVQYEAGSGVLPSLQRVSSTRGPAQIVFTAHLTDTTGIGPFLRNLADVERFVTEVWLHHEEGARAPVYLERRLDEGYSGTGDEVVLFGRGATYYRVLSIDAINLPGPQHAILASGWLPDAQFRLTCDPSPVGKPQICAAATGWVRTDSDGNIQLWSGGTNLIHNPSFEHATFNTDWSEEHGDLQDVVEYERVRTGWQSCLLRNTHASNTYKYTVTLTLSIVPYALSAYVYTDGSAVTSADCVLYGQGAALTTTFTADSDHPGWYRMTAIFQGLNASSTHGLQVKALKVIYIDDVQLEALPISKYFGHLNGTTLGNGGFETAGAGGADIWANWTEVASDGALADEAALMYAGSHAAKLTAGPGRDTLIFQTMAVTESTWYLLTFYQRGDAGANAGRFAINDETHTTYIIGATATGITAAAYSQRGYLFQTPAGCTSLGVYFFCPDNNTSVCYVDDVALQTYDSTIACPWSPFMLDGFDPGPGVAWGGTAHDSNQTRTFGLAYYYSDIATLRGQKMIDASKGTLCLWVKTPWAGPDNMQHNLLYTVGLGSIWIAKEYNNTLLARFGDNSMSNYKDLSIALTTSNWPANTWLCIIVTWAAGTPTGLYLYGATAASDTSVSTTGTYIPICGLGYQFLMGDTSTLTQGWDGWIGDLRIFGKDATTTPAALYASRRGRSELPFVWTKTLADIDNTADSANSNMAFIANLPGDLPGPCRIILNNPDGADDFNKGYFGIRINGNLCTNLNVVEGAAGTDATDGADAARSGGSRTRVAPAATTEPAAYNVRFTILADGRKAPLVYGRYKIVAVVRDGAASTGVFKARLKTVLNSTVVMETGEWVSAGRVDASDYVLLDMGTFTIPPLDPPQVFLGQGLAQTGDRTAYCYADMYVWMTSGAALNFDVDCIICFPERLSGYIYDSVQNWTHGNSIFIDTISSPPRTYMTEAASTGASYPDNITFDPFQRVDVQCDWPVLPPGTWCFVNQVVEEVTAGHAIDDDTNWLVQYQPVYLWGR